jgi:hypothetical protein
LKRFAEQEKVATERWSETCRMLKQADALSVAPSTDPELY